MKIDDWEEEERILARGWRTTYFAVNWPCTGSKITEIRRSSLLRRDTLFFILAPRYVRLPLSRRNALVNYYVPFIAWNLCDQFESGKTSKLSLGAATYAWVVVRRPWRSASWQPLGASYWIREDIEKRNRQTVSDKLQNGSISKQRRCSGLYRRSHS